jgi:hypothetical protein
MADKLIVIATYICNSKINRFSKFSFLKQTTFLFTPL